jgi:ribose/xylose/arabinose/galactoside ABC-type transport system permease subunit
LVPAAPATICCRTTANSLRQRRPGKPNALGTLLGAVILGVLQNGLVMMSVPYYAMDIIKGLVLAVAQAQTYIQKR